MLGVCSGVVHCGEEADCSGEILCFMKMFFTGALGFPTVVFFSLFFDSYASDASSGKGMGLATSLGDGLLAVSMNLHAR